MEWILRSIDDYKISNKSDLKYELCNWCTDREKKIYEKLHYLKRRSDWLLSRLATKELIQKYYIKQYGKKINFCHIATFNELSGQPYFKVWDKINNVWNRPSLMISMSHSNSSAFCAVHSNASNTKIGVDIEYVVDLYQSFAKYFLHPLEQDQLKNLSYQEYKITLIAIWSLKEAFLKALSIGLRVDTRDIIVYLNTLPNKSWQNCKIKSRLTDGSIDAHCKLFNNYILSKVDISVKSTSSVKYPGF